MNKVRIRVREGLSGLVAMIVKDGAEKSIDRNRLDKRHLQELEEHGYVYMNIYRDFLS